MIRAKPEERGGVERTRSVRRHLPIRVESACREDWSAMTPRGEGRHCARCQSTVIDLTRVTRAQAERLVREHGGRVCGRVRADERGDAVFAPEPVRRGIVPVAIAGVLAACSAEPTAADATAPDALPAATHPTVGLGPPTSGSFGGSLATGVMLPIGRAPVRPPSAPAIGRALPPVDETPAEPTPEQQALTRRKHRRQHPPAHPPPIAHPMMGAIVMPDF